MQEKLRIGDTISFIMNGKPITPVVNPEVKQKPEKVPSPQEKKK